MWKMRIDAFVGILQTQGLPSDIERIEKVIFPGKTKWQGNTMWAAPDAPRDEQAMMLLSLLKAFL